MTDCWRSGLLSSRMTDVGVTCAPGRRTSFSTRPLVVAGNPADVLGHQDAGAADLTNHRAAFDGVDPDRGAVDAWGGGAEPRDADRDQHDGEEGDDAVDDAANLLLAFDFWGASYIDH